MRVTRMGQSASLLKSGHVLVTDGTNGSHVSNSVEIYTA